MAVAGVDRHDPRLDRASVGVGVAELLAGRGHAGLRSLAVRVPIMFEWTVQTNAYCPASSAGTS